MASFLLNCVDTPVAILLPQIMKQDTLILTPETYIADDLQKAIRFDKTIDWECSCIKPYLNGPCVEEFKRAYECYVKNNFEKEACIREIIMYQYCTSGIGRVEWLTSTYSKLKHGVCRLFKWR